ncbi:MAG: porphobilinogen synthase, partial [Chloroflexi bacterium]
MGFPTARPRRLRSSPQIRAMVRETDLTPDDLIYPLFITHGRGVRSEISSMAGVYNLSPDVMADEIRSVSDLDIPAVLLF